MTEATNCLSGLPGEAEL